jgi:hypothetical protein
VSLDNLFVNHLIVELKLLKLDLRVKVQAHSDAFAELVFGLEELFVDLVQFPTFADHLLLILYLISVISQFDIIFRNEIIGDSF